MRVSMLFPKAATLIILSGVFTVTASDPPHLSLLSVPRAALGQRETRMGGSQIDFVGGEMEVGLWGRGQCLVQAPRSLVAGPGLEHGTPRTPTP